MALATCLVADQSASIIHQNMAKIKLLTVAGPLLCHPAQAHRVVQLLENRLSWGIERPLVMLAVHSDDEQAAAEQFKTVLAVLRRLNNARGHLQFRYESRKQATLRNYLCQEFGNRSDCRNAVLRVVETGPHTFLFEPVSVGHKQAPSLSLYRPYFHNLSEEYARETYEFSELQRCLTSIDYDENYSQIDYNALISRNLRQTGWKQEVRIVKEIGLRCDFEKNGIWLVVEFGNARVYYQNYIKFLLALRYQEARFGILLCPTNAFAQLLCDLGQRRAALKRKSSTECRPTYSGMMSYEKAIRELPFLKFIFTGRILIGGIEIQALPHSA